MPARDHLAVRAEAVPLVAYLRPLIYHTASVIQEEVPAVIYLAPACDHGTVGLKIIIYRGAVICKLKPACLELSAGRIEIIPHVGHLYPAGFHNAVCSEIVPDVIYLCPALLHVAVVPHVIINIGAVAAHAKPVAGDDLSVILVVIVAVALLPARKRRHGKCAHKCRAQD